MGRTPEPPPPPVLVWSTSEGGYQPWLEESSGSRRGVSVLFPPLSDGVSPLRPGVPGPITSCRVGTRDRGAGSGAGGKPHVAYMMLRRVGVRGLGEGACVRKNWILERLWPVCRGDWTLPPAGKSPPGCSRTGEYSVGSLLMHFIVLVISSLGSQRERFSGHPN